MSIWLLWTPCAEVGGVGISGGNDTRSCDSAQRCMRIARTKEVGVDSLLERKGCSGMVMSICIYIALFVQPPCGCKIHGRSKYEKWLCELEKKKEKRWRSPITLLSFEGKLPGTVLMSCCCCCCYQYFMLWRKGRVRVIFGETNL